MNIVATPLSPRAKRSNLSLRHVPSLPCQAGFLSKCVVRQFSLGRSLMRGNQPTEVWVREGVFARNLWQAAGIIVKSNEAIAGGA
ncbi:MAG: hypothetical protein WBE46_09725 [Dehalococcoidia bacterium]